MESSEIGHVNFAHQNTKTTGGDIAKVLDRNLVLLLMGILYIITNYSKPITDIFLGSSFLAENLGRSVGLLAFILAFGNRSLRVFLLRNKKYFVLLFSFICIFFISALFSSASGSIDIVATIHVLYDIVTSWLVFLIFLYLCLQERNTKAILSVMVVLALSNSLVGLWGFADGRTLFDVSPYEVGFGTFGYDLFTGRAGGVRGENYTGIWNAPGVAVGIMLLLNKKGLRRFLGLLIFIVSALAIIVSLSRTSVVCGLIITMGGILLSWRKKNFLGLAMLVSLLMVLVSFQVDVLTEGYLEDPGKYDMYSKWLAANLEGEERLSIWNSYLNIWLKSPIWGRGPGFIHEEVSGGSLVPHNSFLDILVEFGLFGVLIYIVAFIPGLRSFIDLVRFPSPRIIDSIFSLCFLGAIVGLFTLSNPFMKIIWILAGCSEGRRFAAKGQMLFRSNA